MDTIIIWVIICLISILWGVLHYKAEYYADINKHNTYFKFLEFWRSCINYFITLTIIYYFVSIRSISIIQDNNFLASDFILGVVFLMGVFGWLPYFVKNITEGINAIIAKILK